MYTTTTTIGMLGGQNINKGNKKQQALGSRHRPRPENTWRIKEDRYVVSCYYFFKLWFSWYRAQEQSM